MRVDSPKIHYWSQQRCDAEGVCYQELDEHGLILKVNQVWLDAVGRTSQEVVGHDIMDYVEPESYPDIDCHFPILKVHGEINHVRFNFRFADEKYREVLLFGRSEFDSEGNFIKTHCWFAPLEHFLENRTNLLSLLDEVGEIQTRLTDHSNFLEWVFHSVKSLLVVIKDQKIVRANRAFLSFSATPAYTDLSQLNTSITRALLRELNRCEDLTVSSSIPMIELRNPVTQETHYFECDITPMSYSEGEQILLLTDVTEARLAKQSLVAEEAKSLGYFQVARVMMIALDVRGVVTMINRKGCDVLGYQEEDIVGKNWFELAVRPQDRKKDESYFYGVLDSAIDDSSDYLTQICTKRGEKRVLSSRSVALKDEYGVPIGVLSSAEDITELQKTHQLMKHMAHHDGLTELPNRSALKLRLTEAIKRAEKFDSKLAVGFIDLDNFKPINDLHGHQEGDEVLIAVSKRLQNLIRKTDILSRFGGDEFVFVLDQFSEYEELDELSQKLSNSIRQPFNIRGTMHKVSMSLGLSVYPKDGLTAMELIENADTAMYEAKRNGKNQYAFYNSDIRLQQVQRYEMQQALEVAVERSEFVVFYQPQIDHKNKKVVGLEALVRWQHPEKGLILPDEFIPLAEEFKLIIPIGEQVLRQACLDVKQLHDEQRFSGSMSVNISGIQIDSDQFLNMVNQVLEETQVTPTLLEMEITESVVMTNPEKWIALFKSLKSIGLRLAIDDFGKGYSSLTHLSDLPLDKLKIDMSFVKHLPHDKKARAIAQSIIDLSENMGMVSLAEGIERPEQQAFLEQQNCEIGQGFLFARPMPFDALKDWLLEYENSTQQVSA